MNQNSKLIYLGQWQFSDQPIGVVSFYSPIQLGTNQLNGIVLGGWAYAGWSNTKIYPIRIAVLDQNPDGTLAISTAKYITDSQTNGQGSIIVADFNRDGKNDIFLAAHNESPLVPTASTAYLSNVNGTFHKITLADSIEAHSSNLGFLNGVPTIVTTGYGPTDPYYQFDSKTSSFQVNTWGNTYSGSLYGSTGLAGDFNGDGISELVIGDFKTGPGYAYDRSQPHKLVVYQLNGNALASNPSFIGNLYFDGKAQYQNQGLVSEWSGLSHNYRVWKDDFNYDQKPDLLLGVGIWSSNLGWQKNKLQMLQNQGQLNFADVTDRLGQAYDENTSFVDYSMQILDLDRSGINSYLLAGDPTARGADQSNYLLVNDGTGKLHTALHEEFSQWAGQLALKFIPYQLADGTINYVAQTANGALYNFPLRYNITTDFTNSIQVVDRNQSMLMRTWAGKDTFLDINPNAAPAKIDGGLGLDTSIYSDKATNYSIRLLSNQSFEVKHTVSNNFANVSDTLTNIERLQFADTNLALDVGPTQNAGSLYMLYKAAFNRVPDEGGMGYWLAQVDGGKNLVNDIAAGFVNAPEFVAKYGTNPTNAFYVDQLYKNVLGRPGEAGGVAYWNQELNSGARSKAEVLVQFATLQEGAGLVANLIANGIAYQEWVG